MLTCGMLPKDGVASHSRESLPGNVCPFDGCTYVLYLWVTLVRKHESRDTSKVPGHLNFMSSLCWCCAVDDSLTELLSSFIAQKGASESPFGGWAGGDHVYRTLTCYTFPMHRR